MTTRRTLLAMAAGFAAPAFPAAASADAGSAQNPPGTLSKAQVGYQDIPSKGQVCAQCVYFIFVQSNSAVAASRCKLVAGPINPAGWCEVWAPKV